MEEKQPTYDLSYIRRLIDDGNIRPTDKVHQDAYGLGFSTTEMIEVVYGLENKDFYKSMPSKSKKYGDKWQDVYKKTVRGIPLYIKFKVWEFFGVRVVIMSFKEDLSAH